MMSFAGGETLLNKRYSGEEVVQYKCPCFKKNFSSSSMCENKVNDCQSLSPLIGSITKEGKKLFS